MMQVLVLALLQRTPADPAAPGPASPIPRPNLSSGLIDTSDKACVPGATRSKARARSG
jgi:hypothetical protein